MTVLAFDISTGGVSASVFDSTLNALQVEESNWSLGMDSSGSATLALDDVVERCKIVIRSLDLPAKLDAVVIGCFMHNCVLLRSDEKPVTPVFTWLDRHGEDGVEYIRSRLGGRFHERTGCRFHPMFPVFKLANLFVHNEAVLSETRRVVSVKTFLAKRWTGFWTEDQGTASASGLYNIQDGDWDPLLLRLVGIGKEKLPLVESRTQIIGKVTPQAAAEFGLPESTPVINGSGDGLLANVGSGCEIPERIAITLGTSGSARQTLGEPILDPDAGTFCYKASERHYVFGCASNNGGNVLDWARSLFGDLPVDRASKNTPIFIPLLHGERAPDWNPHLTGSWHGLTARHSEKDLGRSVLEGVLFNLAHYVEILQGASKHKATDIVLSGNGFLQPLAASILASVTGLKTWLPSKPGLASLRGAAICAHEALHASIPELEAQSVPQLDDLDLSQRYVRYKELRSAVSSGYFK